MMPPAADGGRDRKIKPTKSKPKPRLAVTPESCTVTYRWWVMMDATDFCKVHKNFVDNNLNPFTADPVEALHFAILV